MQHVLALNVGKVDVGQAHVAAQGSIGQAAVAVRVLPCPFAGALCCLGQAAVRVLGDVYKSDIAVVCLGLLIHQGKDAPCTRTCHDDGVYLLGEGIDVAGELLCHIKERNKDSDIENLAGNTEVRSTCQQQYAADQRKHDIEDIAYVADDRTEDAGVGVRLEAVVTELVVYAVKVLNALRLVAEHLDDLLAIHHLLHKAFGIGNGALLFHEEARRAAAEALGNEEHKHYACKQHESHPYAEVQHDREHDQHYRAGLYKRRQRLADKHAQGVDVVCVMAHDIAVLMGVKIADGQILHVVEHLAAELVKVALGHVCHELGIGRHGYQREHIQRRKQRDVRDDLRLGGCPVTAEVPLFNYRKHVLHEQRRDRGHDRRKQYAEHCERRHHGVILEQLLYRPTESLGVGCAHRAALRSAFAHITHRPHLRSSAVHRSRGISGCAP